MSAVVSLERPEIKPPALPGSSWVVVRRNLIHIKRMPELLLDVTIQPVMFVLLFAFVFGGAIQVPGNFDYKEFLVPGIMAQTMAFASFIVAIGLVNDLDKGIVDRLKSLPISRSSILVGRSVSSLIHSSIGIGVMALTGLAIGWRAHNGFTDTVLGFALLLLFGFSMIWLGIWVGSSMRSVESVNGVMFTTMFPITFVANTFAPTQGMPDWLATIAEWNPISALVQALRDLWGNGLPATGNEAWPLQHPVVTTVIWAVGLTAIFAPLAVASFRRRSRD
ncbi:MAG TPA: ABC transporter permease [Nocardioides sp.]|uniref:ABC transporter permease n=1 Tax=Nocardioides sp. TaxID=35761 RepID=UPI002D8040CA|nr:ABC transporter permease [Nocardioides sp.]HET6652634.1 ABC transporter permease [Nocardioides sp.]